MVAGHTDIIYMCSEKYQSIKKVFFSPDELGWREIGNMKASHPQ